MKELLNLHNDVMRKVLMKYNGYEVKTEGDAFMVAFQEASDGLGFALEAQQRLFDVAWPDWLLTSPQMAHVGGMSEDKAWRGLRVR